MDKYNSNNSFKISVQLSNKLIKKFRVDFAHKFWRYRKLYNVVFKQHIDFLSANRQKTLFLIYL